MATSRFNDPIEPMTLGNTRANGVRSLDVSCHLEAATPRPHQEHRFFGFWLEKSLNSKVSISSAFRGAREPHDRTLPPTEVCSRARRQPAHPCRSPATG